MPSARPKLHWLQRTTEILGILVLCYLYAGSPPPGVNEPHYLGKAKHYWNPAWCAGDFFLESGDAHEVFFWTFGWVTQFFTLDQSAWLGRLIVWLLFALSWRSLVSKITDVRYGGLLSAMLLIPLIHYFHLAGEWLIGGIEAKGFAWPLVFWGLAKICEKRWWAAWPLFGLASSFHVIIGGWAVIAGLLAWWWRREEDNLRWQVLLPWLVVGGCLSLPGLLPALQLTAQATAEEMREASITYTYRRLSHHLVFYRFNKLYMLRFALLTLGTWYLSRQVAPTDRMRRLRAFVAGTLVIALGGVAIDQLLGPFSQGLRASLLRYYWFRMSDILVPTGAAIMLITALRIPESRLPAWALSVGLVLSALGIGQAMHTHGFGASPMAIQQQRWPNVPASFEAEQIDAAWLDVCEWIQDEQNVPREVTFLTPTRQQTFKWYAHRPDVVTWKDVPQDAQALNQWWTRRIEVSSLKNWPWYHMEEFANIVQQYGVTHVVWPDPLDRNVPGDVEQIYRNELFRVFQLP